MKSIINVLFFAALISGCDSTTAPVPAAPEAAPSASAVVVEAKPVVDAAVEAAPSAVAPAASATVAASAVAPVVSASAAASAKVAPAKKK